MFGYPSADAPAPAVDQVAQPTAPLANSVPTTDNPAQREEQDPKQIALIAAVIDDIRKDKKHFEKDFKQMRKDMHQAKRGSDEEWGEEKYRANLTGRHIKRKTASLYAKNPTVVAVKPDYMYFEIWDESPESLAQAFDTVANAKVAMAAAASGMAVTAAVAPDLVAVQNAEMLLEDNQRGMAVKLQLDRIAKTFVILFNKSLEDQKPLDFKTALKGLVRRALTCSVGYIELSMQREMGPSPITSAKLADSQARLDRLKSLTEQAQTGELDDMQAEQAQLSNGVASLQAEPDIVLREGLIFDFPSSMRVIPDRRTERLVGFVGAERVTIEYDYSVKKIRDEFGIDLTKVATKNMSREENPLIVDDGSRSSAGGFRKDDDKVLLWKSYNKTDGQVYVVVEGYQGWVKPPAAPDVFVEDFWPVYALTFNEVEDDKGIFPPSDVQLIQHMQKEHNRSREGMRQHRKAAQPRWVSRNGAIEQDDLDSVAVAKSFTNTVINVPEKMKLGDAFDVFPVPGVDPNLYETHQFFDDLNLVVGTPETRFGETNTGTATQAQLAESSSSSVDECDIDELDAFLSRVVRAGGQILQKETSPEIVKQKCGPGALWPDATLQQIAECMYLKTAAGSTGRPNKALEVSNWVQMLPFLIQMPAIKKGFLATESLKRLDDKMDLSEAIDVSQMSIAAENTASGGMSPGNGNEAAGPGKEPSQQGHKGANNAPTPAKQPGSKAPMGSNH